MLHPPPKLESACCKADYLMLKVLPHWGTFFAALLISIFNLFNGPSLGGELKPFFVQLEMVYLIVYIVVVVASFLMIVPLWSLLIRFHFKTLFNVRKARLTKFFTILVTVDLLFTLSTGYGTVFRHETGPFSFLTGLIDPSWLFPVFYIFTRQSIRTFWFFSIVLLFGLGQILKGWTGFLLAVFFLELFFQMQRISFRKQLAVVVCTPFFVLILGGLIYSFITPVKNSIRGFETASAGHWEGIRELGSRLSFLPVSVGGIQAVESVSGLYRAEGYTLKEALGFLKPIVPRSLMPDKEFRSLNNNVLNAYYEQYGVNQSADLGIVAYAYLLFVASPLDATLNLILAFILLFLFKFFYDSISPVKGYLDFLVYLIVFKVFYTFSIEHVFARDFISLIFVSVLLFFTGTLKVVSRRMPSEELCGDRLNKNSLNVNMLSPMNK
jgi:hypothetical protein